MGKILNFESAARNQQEQIINSEEIPKEQSETVEKSYSERGNELKNSVLKAGKNKWESTWSKIKNGASWLAEKTGKTVDLTFGTPYAIADAAAKGVGNLEKGIDTTAETIANAPGAAGRAIGEVAAKGVRGLEKGIDSTTELVGKGIKSTKENIKKGAENVYVGAVLRYQRLEKRGVRAYEGLVDGIGSVKGKWDNWRNRKRAEKLAKEHAQNQERIDYYQNQLAPLMKRQEEIHQLRAKLLGNNEQLAEAA